MPMQRARTQGSSKSVIFGHGTRAHARLASVKHSAQFTAVRDAIIALAENGDRARLAGLLGNMADPHRPLGPDLRRVLRAIAALDDADLERLARWFSTWVSRWGQMPRSTGMSIDPKARRDPPGE